MPRPAAVRLPIVAFAATLLAIGLALAAAQIGTARGKSQKPQTIALPNGFQPEGIASGRGNELFVGSIPTGRVVRVDPKRGTTSPVVPEREGRAAIGLKYHQRKLFVAGGPTGRAFVYDARTGDDVADVQLTPPPTFINDVAVTRRGAFFTDSQRQQLYRLDVRTSTATTIPITGDFAIDDDTSTFEANGIAAARGGRTLLVIQSRTGGLFTVDSASGASEQVTVTGGEDDGKLLNGDGLLLKGRTLYVVQNEKNQIAVVRLSGDLTRGVIERVITDRDLDVPTTIARLQGDLFAVNAKFGIDDPESAPYEVVRLREGGRSRGRGKGQG